MTNDRLDELQKMRDDIERLEGALSMIRTSSFDHINLVGGYRNDPAQSYCSSSYDYIMTLDGDLKYRLINYLDKKVTELKEKFEEA
ncbi:MAG: hypothetical protein J6U54_01205 [Clostridiales bacterium]|nr:hypothetical protein [Clostridiales bacterium]